MKGFLFIIGIFSLLLINTACNKDGDKIAQLEKEVIEAENENYIQTDTKKAKSAIETSEIRNRQYAFSPDMTPDETVISNNSKPESSPIISISTAEAKNMSEIPEPMQTITSANIIQSSKQITRQGYAVQIASMTNRTEAEELCGTFINRGYEPFITATTVHGREYFRVRIGDFNGYSAARRFGAELKSKFSVEYWVTKNSE